MRRGLLVAGIALIAVAIAFFIIGAYITAKTFKPLTESATLNPGANITIGIASPGKALTIYYSSSINKPLKVYSNESGFMITTYRDGYYVTVFTIQNGTSTLYLVNNYSTPIVIKYSIATLTISSSIVGGVLVLLSIVVGIVGVILIILGLILKPRK